jgi:hypothetical protein
MRNFFCFTLILFVIAINQTACEKMSAEIPDETAKIQETATEIAGEPAETQEKTTGIQKMTTDIQEKTTEILDAFTAAESKINYSELNDMIDNKIYQKLSAVIQFIKKYLLIAWAFFLSWPAWIKNTIYISLFPASIGIIASHVIGIYKNRNKWHKHPNYELMYSYFVKSGTLQRKESYKEAHKLLRDHKWSWVSFAGLAYRLGNYTNKSVMLMFALTFVYIPLSIFGFVEMVLRITCGTAWLLLFNMIHRLMLFATKLISYLFIPVSYFIDKIIQKTQYCPHCYETFELPVFVCPACGRKHARLIPGSCGVLFTRCACNNIFLPCAAFTGRSRKTSECPVCAGELAAANARHFSLVAAGGNSAGKTAFIAAFSNLYAERNKYARALTIEGKPGNYFIELDKMFRSEKNVNDTESRTYSIVHKHGKIETDNLVFYDTLAKYVESDSFPRSPKYLGFCDGIILIIDPLSVQSVRQELANNNINIKYGSSDDTNILVVHFIHQYNTICGHTAGIMSDTPVAVLLNKADIEVVNREIGRATIKSLYNENPSRYNNNESTARDQICRSYLVKIGLVNVLNNIDATFTNVCFFPVSATGNTEEGKAYNPIGVIEPVAWIAKKKRSRITHLLLSKKDQITEG